MFTKRIVHSSLGWLSVLVLTASAARSGGEQLLWQDTVDRGTFDQAFDVAVHHDAVFVAGFVGAFNNRDFILRAYDARDGTTRWESIVDTGTNAFASGVAAAGKTVFVSGVVLSDWRVRAHDVETGQLLWEDRFGRLGVSDSPRPGAIAVSDGLLFVVGSAESLSVWVVRAYDADTGRLVWQDEFAVGPGIHSAESLLLDGGRVVVGGFGTAPDSDYLIVRAYASGTGTLLWEHRTASAPQQTSTLRGLGSDGRRIFAGGAVTNPTGKTDFLVLALDARTGTLLWTDRVDSGGDFDYADGIAVSGRRLFVHGWGGRACIFEESPPSDCDVLIRSYDGDTGRLLWETRAGVPRIDDASTAGTLVTARGLLFGAWPVNLPTDGPKGDWLVQAYRASTGHLVWEDRVDTGGGVRFTGIETPLSVAVSGSRLFVVGRTVDPLDNWNFVIRAYHIGDDSFDEDDADHRDRGDENQSSVP